MTLPIISDVPLAPLIRRQRRRKYEFEKMAVGDMFFVPGNQTLAPYVSSVGKRLGFKFTTRRLWMTNKRSKSGQSWRPCTKDVAGAVFGTGVWRVA